MEAKEVIERISLDKEQSDMLLTVLDLLQLHVPVYPNTGSDAQGLRFMCGACGALLWVQKDTASLEYNKKSHRFCNYCGQKVKLE